MISAADLPTGIQGNHTCSRSASFAEADANSSKVMCMLCMSGKMMDPRVMSTMCSQLHFSAASERGGKRQFWI